MYVLTINHRSTILFFFSNKIASCFVDLGKVKCVIDVEGKITNQMISSKLKWAKVNLFKAKQKDLRVEYTISDIGYNYIQALTYSNLDKIVTDLSNIRVINVDDAHHGNILEFEDILLPQIG